MQNVSYSCEIHVLLLGGICAVVAWCEVLQQHRIVHDDPTTECCIGF